MRKPVCMCDNKRHRSAVLPSCRLISVFVFRCCQDLVSKIPLNHPLTEDKFSCQCEHLQENLCTNMHGLSRNHDSNYKFLLQNMNTLHVYVIWDAANMNRLIRLINRLPQDMLFSFTSAYMPL